MIMPAYKNTEIYDLDFSELFQTEGKLLQWPSGNMGYDLYNREDAMLTSFNIFPNKQNTADGQVELYFEINGMKYHGAIRFGLRFDLITLIGSSKAFQDEYGVLSYYRSNYKEETELPFYKFWLNDPDTFLMMGNQYAMEIKVNEVYITQ